MGNTNSVISVYTALPHYRIFVHIRVKLVHLILSVVEVVEQNPDNATSNERRTGKTSKHPLDLGVNDKRVESLGDGRSESVGEEVHGLDEGLHARWGFCVRVLESSDGSEDLGETNEYVGTGLRSNVDVVTLVNAINQVSVAVNGMEIARTGPVNVVLDDAGVNHGQRCDPESSYDAVDGREVNPVLAERGHEPLVDNGQEDDDGDGIEILHQIVGNTVEAHLAGLGDEIVGEVTVDDPVNGVEGEDLAGNKSTFDLFDKVVVPHENLGLAHTGLVRWLSSIHLAVLDHQPDNTEGIGNDGSLRRSDNIDLATEDEDEQPDEEDAETEQVGGPEVDVALQVRGSEQRQRSGVDAPVEDLY
jgi:hypothetical protein